MKLAIVGYRYCEDYKMLERIINDWVKENGTPECIVSGGCKGVDTMARKYAKSHDIDMKEFLPDWKKYKGKQAYAMRDKEIASFCDMMIAVPSSKGKGTQLTIKFAQREGKPVEVHWVG